MRESCQIGVAEYAGRVSHSGTLGARNWVSQGAGYVALSLLVLVVPVLLGQPLKVGALLLIICEKPSQVLGVFGPRRPSSTAACSASTGLVPVGNRTHAERRG